MAGLGTALGYMAAGIAQGVGTSIVDEAKAMREAQLRRLEQDDQRAFVTSERKASEEFEMDKAKTVKQMEIDAARAKKDADSYRWMTTEEKIAQGINPAEPWQINGNNQAKKAGGEGTTVNIDQRTDGAFKKKLAEKQAETFDAMSTEGMNAKADIGIIDELDGILKGQGGSLTGIKAKLAGYGIGGEDMDDLQAATALINKLVPTQRQPGSGTMSDRDVELFKSSLPSLWNQPGGNEKILRVMRAMAEYKQAQGEIADRVITEEITPQEGRAELMALPNPLAEFSKTDKEEPSGSGARKTKSGVTWSVE